MASSIVACPSCGKKNRVPVAAKGRLRCAVCSADLPYLVSADDTDFDAAVDTTQIVLLDLWAVVRPMPPGRAGRRAAEPRFRRQAQGGQSQRR